MKRTERLLALALALMLGAAVASAEAQVGAIEGAAVRDEAAAGDRIPIEAVLAALGEDAYRAAWEALAAGEVVARGTRGEAALGVQQTLIAFGQEIAADGDVGPRTLEALNEVQAAYGLEPTEGVDAAGYAALLVRLLVQTDMEAASELLSGALGGEYQYICGCVHARAGRWYSAWRCFNLSRWGDWMARAATCEQPWPATGRLYKSASLKGGDVELIVQRTGDAETAALIKVYTQRGSLAATLFIGGTGEAALVLPAGTYMIKQGVGSAWFGEAETFGEAGYYEVMTFDGGVRRVRFKPGKAYTVTIDPPRTNPEAKDVGTAYESWGSF